jgi:hypothetical protein
MFDSNVQAQFQRFLSRPPSLFSTHRSSLAFPLGLSFSNAPLVAKFKHLGASCSPFIFCVLRCSLSLNPQKSSQLQRFTHLIGPHSIWSHKAL